MVEKETLQSRKLSPNPIINRSIRPERISPPLTVNPPKQTPLDNARQLAPFSPLRNSNLGRDQLLTRLLATDFLPFRVNNISITSEPTLPFDFIGGGQANLAVTSYRR